MGISQYICFYVEYFILLLRLHWEVQIIVEFLHGSFGSFTYSSSLSVNFLWLQLAEINLGRLIN